MHDSTTMSEHTFATSTTLLEQAPQSDQVPPPWNTACSAIEELFFFNSNIKLTHGLTPVQAWNRIWKHPDAELVTPEALESLKHELMKLVTCYG
jgi:hypothetical protein